MRFLAQLHRWLGIALCLSFAAWFISGAIMIYVPFPTLSNQQRWAGSAQIDVSRLAVGPAVAVAAAGPQPIDRLRLLDIAGRPVYVLHRRDGSIVAVGADNGLPISAVNSGEARTIAESFASRRALRVEGPIDNDQWIVPNVYDAYRPFYRVRLVGADQSVLYVSTRSGEVLQRTLGHERVWNYFGSIVHWLYPTLLRKHADLWRYLLWGLSLAGIFVVIAGIWLGVSRMRAAYLRGRSISPYRSWHRWHHILGLAAGLFLLTWIFSGWLSVDPGWLFSDPVPAQTVRERYRNLPIDQAARAFELSVLKSQAASREMEITAINGAPMLVVHDKAGVRVLTPDGTVLADGGAVPRPLILAAVQVAWPGRAITKVEQLRPEDTYGNVREDDAAVSESALRVELDDPSRTWVHVDLTTGEMVSIMDRGRRVRRWLFNALHSLDFPGLANHRPWWDGVIVALLMIGFLFSMTAAVIGVKRLKVMTKPKKSPSWP